MTRTCPLSYLVMISKDHTTFKLADISTYRTQLMGIATMMIIICHAEASGVLIPGWLTRICNYGNYGVDIFLFLSGLGLSYSLNKLETNGGGIFIWYKKRYLRILIPYLIVYVPYCIIFLLLGKYSVVDSILCLSTLEYWLFHRGAWFVSLILVLYFIAPLLYMLLSGNRRIAFALGMIAIIMVLGNISLKDFGSNVIMANVQGALERTPSFIFGMVLAFYCKSQKSVSVFWIIMLAILWIISSKVFHIAAVEWLLVPSILYMSYYFLRLFNFQWIMKSITFLGNISLESYLTNITLNSILLLLIPAYITSSVFYGRYLEYGIVVVIGLTSAFLIHQMSVSIMKKIEINN